MTKTFGVGIVGFGDGGQSNFRAIVQPRLYKFPAHVVAICDPDEEQLYSTLPKGGEETPVELYFDVNELLHSPNVDIVVVATPDNQHFTVAEKALDAGKNVFIEKPVATTLEGLGGVSRLADHYPGKMLFSEKYSFATPVQSVLRYRQELGEFMTGSTSYVMWNCDRIMGGGKWRTEHEYNPAAGGLSHNFMTLLLFTGRRITEVCAVGQVLTYHENLDRYHGFDTMRGLLRFEGGTVISFDICLAIQGRKSPYAHRTVLHNLQFRNGGLAYGPDPSADHLVVGEEERPISPEKSEKDWGLYNIGQLYVSMWDNLIDSLLGKTKPLHTIEHGLNVAATCVQAFESAKQDGVWLRVPF